MTRVVLNDVQVVAALDAIQQRSEICDPAGRVLGYYVPNEAMKQASRRQVQSPYSKEELERRFREEAKDAKPLAEFWEDMRQKHPEKFQ